MLDFFSVEHQLLDVMLRLLLINTNIENDDSNRFNS